MAMPSELRDAYNNTRIDLLRYRYGWHSSAIRAAILTVLPDEPISNGGAESESEMIRHDERCRVRSKFLELADALTNPDALTNQQEQADA
jgi:hypothetical protein